MAKRGGQNDRLRRAREERNWTQADVAEAVGTSSFTVSRWELGVQTPQPHFREKLCALFALGPEELGLVAPAANGRAAEHPEAADPAEARARRDLLAQVWRYWIGTEREAAVGRLPRIELTLTERPDAVDDPLRVETTPRRPDRPLPRGATIETAYARAGEQLLVLGDPGAGKTTMLLDLVQSLLEQEPAGAMPVVFHLSSWAESRRPLWRWLVEELHRRYGVARRLSRRWIAQEQLVPLLDGLDEVAAEHRAACVEAINAFHDEHGQLPMVVCCRTAPYEALGVRLRLRGAVQIRPLTRAQVERYLDEACAGDGDGLHGVRALLREDGRLRDLLTTPLLLGMVVRTYGGERSATPPLRGPLAERRQRVLSDYVDEMLTSARAAASARYERGQTAAWLAWLARAMRDHDEAVFSLDWMQPSWLPTSAQRRLVRLAPAFLMVLVGALAGMLDMLAAGALLRTRSYRLDLGGGAQLDLSHHVGDAMLAGAAVGVLAGLIAAVFTYERRIAPSNRLGWSWSTFRRNVPGVPAAVLGAVLLSLLVDRVLSGLVVHLVYGVLLVALFGALTGRPPLADHRWHVVLVLAAALAVGAAAALATGTPPSTLLFRLGARLAVGLSLGLMFGPETPLFETVPAPGQGIQLSRRHGLAAGAVSGGLAVLVFGVVDGASVARMAGPSVGVVTGLVDGVAIGVIVGAGVSLRRGLGAYLRHALLLGLLARAGSAPRDYVGFLEHASDLVLLRRRGGGYEFVHRLLLDHFADLDAPPPPIRAPAWDAAPHPVRQLID